MSEMRVFRLTVGVAAFVLAACGGSVDNGGSGGSAGGGAQAGSGGGHTGGSGGATGGSGGAPGGTGGATGGSSGFGGTGGFGGGSGGAPCDALAAAYAQTLTQAKVCNPFMDMETCTQLVPDALVCPCGDTYVSTMNQQALVKLKQIQSQWDAQNCGAGIMCPAIACEQPAAGVCEVDASGSSGSCVDYFLNGV
jgi:hypothetical protein